ncbi:MAG: DUF6666 family protein [Pirellulaceae bacterium]
MMQCMGCGWSQVGVVAWVAMGLALIGRPVSAGDDPAGHTHRLSDSEAWDSGITTRETSFHIVDTGPLTGPSEVPSPLLPAPADASPARIAAVAADTDLKIPRVVQANSGRGPGRERDRVDYAGGEEGWLDNTFVFLAGDGWRNIFDDGSSNFGFRAGFNTGIDLPSDRATMVQVGMSYGAYDFHGREQRLSRDDPIEQQLFATAGLFKRSDVCEGDRFAWGVVYDLLIADEAGARTDSLRLGQVRSQVGYALSESDEVGVWAAFRLMRDDAPGQDLLVNVTDQANLFWHHNWNRGADTWAYVGWADDPGDVVVGLRGEAPLNGHVALLANVHYILPSTRGGDRHPSLDVDNCFNQEAWNVSFGIAIYRCGKAIAPTVSGVRGVPLLPVADNGTLSYQAGLFH